MTLKEIEAARAAGSIIRREFPMYAAGTGKPAIRSAPAEGQHRGFKGIAVPWDDPIDLFGDGSWIESVARGAVEDSDDAKVYWRHREIIGHVLTNGDDSAGWLVDALIADTTQGRDACALLDAGSINRLSIGFIPLEWTRQEDGSIVYTRIRVLEVSLVPHPAYGGAVITEIRSTPTPKGTTLDTETDAPLTRADLDPINDALNLMERQIASQGSATPSPSAVIPAFRSMGEFVHAVANGDQAAIDFHRDFAGGKIEDAIVKDSWVGDYTRLIEKRRRTMNQFQHGVLPATGMTVEYAELKADTTKVEAQENEGDDLAGDGKVTLGTKTADVHTDGGWASQSIQAIKRATIASTDTTYKALFLKYAQRTEARALAEYLALVETNTTASPLSIAADADANDWLDLLIDAAIIYEERGFNLDGLNASVDVFKRLNRLTDGDGRRLMQVWGTGVNQVGELNLSRVDGSLSNVPVSLFGGKTTTGKLSFYDELAIEVLESPGAPIQLQDSNIINLTESFSVYGHTAIIKPFPTAIVPVKLGV